MWKNIIELAKTHPSDFIFFGLFFPICGGLLYFMDGLTWYSIALLSPFILYSQFKKIHLKNNIMDTQKKDGTHLNLDYLLKIALIFGIFFVAFSLAYYFVYRPYQRELSTQYCHRWSDHETKNRSIYKEKFEWCMNEQGW
ncbi:MAG: hypothetical protein E6R05_06145 [Candidatus Moraniibacteriota bacterium]|nr:MAG: hypothetical protein E6R05_06145 [Candidatus Moranbacteria bacterium]